MSLVKKYWPFLIILFLVGAFFYKTLLFNKVPIPGDITVGLYYPWLDYKWGYDVGVPVKNNLPSDIVSVHLPFRIFAADELRMGRIPLWNPLILSGTPLVGNFQSAVFYPLNILLFFFSTIDAWTIQIILQPLLGAVFAYLLLRNWKLSKFASLFGAIVFAFNGFNLVWLEYNIHGHTAYWLPVILLAVDKYFKGRRLIYGALLSLAVALGILSGYPQMVLYHALAVGVYLLFKVNQKNFIKKSLVLSGFAILGLSLAAIQVLPGAELLSLSNRSFDASTIAVANQGFLPLKHLIGLLVPDYFGNPATANWWGKGFYDNFSAFTGVVAFVLAALAVLVNRKKLQVKYLFLLFVISLLLALKTPVSSFIFKTNFLGFQAAVAARALFLSSFAIAMLSAFGIEAYIKEKWNRNMVRVTYIFWIVLLGVLLGTFASRYWLNDYLAGVAYSEAAHGVLDPWLINLKVGIRNLILPLATLFIVTFSLLVKRLRFTNKLFVLGLFALAVFELFRFGHKYLTFSDRALIFPKTPIIEFLLEKQRTEEPFRVIGGDVTPMNMLAPFGIEATTGYDAFYSLDYALFLAEINSGEGAAPLGRYGDIKRYDSELLDLANTKYFLSVKKDEISVPDVEGRPEWYFRLDNLVTVFEDKSVTVLENKNALPRAYLLSDKAGLKFGVYTPTYKKLFIDVAAADELVLVESFSPGWVALIDGKEVSIQKYDSVFKVIDIPTGEHTVEFEYKPKSFELGKLVSGVSLIIIIILLIFSKRLESRNFI